MLAGQPYLLTESSPQSLNHFEGITFFFLDEIVVGASFFLECETRLLLPILRQHLGGMVPEPSNKILCHASQYEARGKGLDVSVSGFLDL